MFSVLDLYVLVLGVSAEITAPNVDHSLATPDSGILYCTDTGTATDTPDTAIPSQLGLAYYHTYHTSFSLSFAFSLSFCSLSFDLLSFPLTCLSFLSFFFFTLLVLCSVYLSLLALDWFCSLETRLLLPSPIKNHHTTLPTTTTTTTANSLSLALYRQGSILSFFPFC